MAGLRRKNMRQSTLAHLEQRLFRLGARRLSPASPRAFLGIVLPSASTSSLRPPPAILPSALIIRLHHEFSVEASFASSRHVVEQGVRHSEELHRDTSHVGAHGRQTGWCSVVGVGLAFFAHMMFVSYLFILGCLMSCLRYGCGMVRCASDVAGATPDRRQTVFARVGFPNPMLSSKTDAPIMAGSRSLHALASS